MACVALRLGRVPGQMRAPANAAALTALPACEPGRSQRLARPGDRVGTGMESRVMPAHAERAIFLAAPQCVDGALIRVSGERGLKGGGGAVKGSGGDVLGGLHHGASQ